MGPVGAQSVAMGQTNTLRSSMTKGPHSDPRGNEAVFICAKVKKKKKKIN